MTAAAQAAFKAHPLSFAEEPEQEFARLKHWQDEDPISLQDAFNTSNALVQAARDDDLEEMRAIVDNAVDGEFLQAFVLQTMAIAVRNTSLEMVTQLAKWGVPLGHEQLFQCPHMVCELTTKENFNNAWRIVQVLTEGNVGGKVHIDTPRLKDGWTPLCVACADACLPLCFKLLDLGADPNVVTRANETPASLAKKPRPNDTAEQKEARGIITNMLRAYGGMSGPKGALKFTHAEGAGQRRRPPPDDEPEAEVPPSGASGREATGGEFTPPSRTDGKIGS